MTVVGKNYESKEVTSSVLCSKPENSSSLGISLHGRTKFQTRKLVALSLELGIFAAL